MVTAQTDAAWVCIPQKCSKASGSAVAQLLTVQSKKYCCQYLRSTMIDACSSSVSQIDSFVELQVQVHLTAHGL